MKVAVLGATGAVGRTMLAVLEDRGFPVDELVPLASDRSAGSEITWRGRPWRVALPGPHSFDGCGLALFSAGADRSREWAPRAADAGAVVVDNSSAWRMDARVPLVVPEVNGSEVGNRPLGIIANPNCAAIQLVIALEALRRAAGLRSVVATTFQSVSGAGQAGLDALRVERAGGDAADSPFVAPIAGNVVPWIGARAADGWNEEETKVRSETRRILGLAALPVAVTCVRVPVEVGHAVAASVDTERPVSVDEAAAALRAMEGVVYCDSSRDPTPRDVAGTDDVRVGRLRADPDSPDRLHLWVVADNLRKGAATNAVQIAERVVNG